MSVFKNFMNLEELSKESKVKMLIYGKSGSGKTTLLSSSALPNITKGLKTLIVLTEENGKLAIAHSYKKGYFSKGSQVVNIKDLNELREVIRFLKSDDNDFDLIGLDSLDDLEDMIKKELIEKKPDKEVLTQQDWQILITKIRNIVKEFRDLDKHVLILSHPTVKVINEEEKLTQPALAGRNQPDIIAGMFNAVGYLYKSSNAGKISRKVLFQGHDNILTKELPELLPLEEPWFPMWIDKIRGIVPRELTFKEYVDFLKNAKKDNKGSKK